MDPKYTPCIALGRRPYMQPHEKAPRSGKVRRTLVAFYKKVANKKRLLNKNLCIFKVFLLTFGKIPLFLNFL